MTMIIFLFHHLRLQLTMGQLRRGAITAPAGFKTQSAINVHARTLTSSVFEKTCAATQRT